MYVNKFLQNKDFLLMEQKGTNYKGLHYHQNHKHTELCAHEKLANYNYFEAEDGNIVWAGALTLAWKELL